jgi:alanine-glyoxylate transaminase/(R)-3-amino-2-methylpropionate-pyruvate transaminase
MGKATTNRPGKPVSAPASSVVRQGDGVDADEVRKKHKEFLFPCVANYYEEPVVLTKGKGAWAFDADGREYLDFFGGILTLGLGHCHPEVVSRVQDQLEQLGHTSTLYPNAIQSRVAERLAKITPGKLKKSLFTTSGTEANETAILLAKIYSGKQEIIALRHGYSGRSLTAQSLTGQAPWRLVPTPWIGSAINAAGCPVVSVRMRSSMSFAHLMPHAPLSYSRPKGQR